MNNKPQSQSQTTTVISQTKFKVLKMIEELSQRGWNPSAREVNRALGAKSSGTIAGNVKRLVKLGLVETFKPSGIALTKKGREELYRRLERSNATIDSEAEEFVSLREKMVNRSVLKLIDDLVRVGRLTNDVMFPKMADTIENKYPLKEIPG